MNYNWCIKDFEKYKKVQKACKKAAFEQNCATSKNQYCSQEEGKYVFERLNKNKTKPWSSILGECSQNPLPNLTNRA